MASVGTGGRARTDVHGNRVVGAPAAVEAYDRAVDAFVRFSPALVPAMRSLTSDHPDFAMGHLLSGFVSLTSTDAPDLRHARRALQRLGELDLDGDDRALAHRDALAAWVAGDWRGAARLLDDLLLRWPADLLALQIGHGLDFYLGDAHNLRDRVGRSLHAYDPAHPHHAFVRGMYAFGLEESGHYEQARSHGLAALDRNPDDVWAVHAVVHTYEMQGMVDDGLRFLRSREADWGAGNLFVVHNRWHQALYQLEAGLPDAALATYDGHIHNDASAGLPLEMLDASALLWRLRLDGVDTGGRFAPLADAWAARALGAAGEPWYAFNDLHAVMAFAGAGRLDDARAVIARLEAYVGSAGPAAGATNVEVTAEIGLPACGAVLAFAEGRDADVLDLLLPIRTILHRFGGSHAQRDALQRTIVDAALRSGRHDLAGALLGERLALRETSVYSLLRWAELLRARGDAAAGAAAAVAEAVGHSTRFATA
jgi:tetratricopeptide (TPR) repeat protein